MTTLAVNCPSTAASLAGNHGIWLAILVGIAVSRFFPGWPTGFLTVAALAGAGIFALAAGVFTGRPVSSGTLSGTVAVIIVTSIVAGLVGLWHGRIRALRHLGVADFAGRLRTIRGVRRWF